MKYILIGYALLRICIIVGIAYVTYHVLEVLVKGG